MYRDRYKIAVVSKLYKTLISEMSNSMFNVVKLDRFYIINKSKATIWDMHRE